MSEFVFNKVAIIGLGLIGGSLARVLKEKKLCGQIVGNSRSAETMQKALSLNFVDEVNADAGAAVVDCDLVILAMPISFTRDCLKSISKSLHKDAIVSDVGSVKQDVIDAVQDVLGAEYPQFVGGHPIAGSEQSGVEAGYADLFKDHKVILTPSSFTDSAATKKIELMWLAAGAEVLFMEAATHDKILAATSHLPHLLAYTLVDTLAAADDNQEIFRYSAGGFRDFTRIASSDPRMWRDIFLSNKKQTLNAIDAFADSLSTLRKAIDDDDGDTLMGTFTRAKSARDHFVAMLDKKAYLAVEADEQNMKAPNMNTQQSYNVEAGGKVTGNIKVPGDKSISHRSIMLGSLAEGLTNISGFLEGEDSLATLQAFRDMGVLIEGPEGGRVTVKGVGLKGLQAPPGPIYVGNSGTSMRLLMGLLAGQAFDSVLIGDESLMTRPMERVAKPLREMGALIETKDGKAPVKISGGAKLSGIDHQMAVASAQVKSAILLAGLYTDEKVSLKQIDVTRDHSEKMLTGFGCPVSQQGLTATIEAGPRHLQAQEIEVPGDISSAAFFIVAALIAPNSEIEIQHVGINPTRAGVLSILKLMGAQIEIKNERLVGGEPVADIVAKSSELKGITIPDDMVSLAIDEFPIVFIAAANAEGITILGNAEELRVKETDRIGVMATGLSQLGIKNTVKDDGIEIEGGAYAGGEVDSGGDHRIAMSFTVAALRASGAIQVKDCANVATSFPGFTDLARQVGINID